ncbi:uncharacterized protein LOC143877993 [Tasmannia lanceolata]|uniref:uncharacterized protein LOC143877993 n=1 Tax=Tasmannia lanceolata TaxID=3420 RepID=UPI0040644019
MDDFLDNILLPSSWQDMNGTDRLSWIGSTTAHADPVGIYEDDEKNSAISIIPSSHIIGSLATQGSIRHAPPDTSVLISGNSSFGLISESVSVPSGLDNGSSESKLKLQGMIESCSENGSLGLKLNTSSTSTLPHSSRQLFSVVGGSAKSSCALFESGSAKGNNREPSSFRQSLEDSHSIEPLWPPSCTSISSLPSVLGQGKIQGFGLQGEFVESESDASILENNFPQPDGLSAAPINEELDETAHPCLPSFAAGHPITLTRASGLQPQQQLQSAEANSIKHYLNHSSFSQLQPVTATAGVCNGAVKPRVRARRGQATDPHSIAERLRREKIADRMKNLQELVPNSNKTDKASMLDEIIEYVKFLQLQVKALSMSRLGAAGAVVPLMTDVQTEGSSSLLLSASVDLSESLDNLAFEQEVVKLMESNVTTAMQKLQAKGLCLMPIALAAAISSGKTSPNPIFSNRKKPGSAIGLVSPSSGSPSAGTQPLSYGNESTMRENMARDNREEITANGCNGAAFKQEDLQKSACSMRELLKPRHS